MTLQQLDSEWLLTPQEMKHKKDLHRLLLDAIDVAIIEGLSREQAAQQIRAACESLLRQHNLPLNLSSRQRIIERIEHDMLGLGPLEKVLADPSVSDILVNSAKCVFVERGGKLEQIPLEFDDDRHVLTVLDRIVSLVGRRVDESSPMVDARLPDGSRVNAIIPPLALDGPSISIRRFPKERLKMANLLAIGSLTEPMAEVLQAVVTGKLNVIISGGTGTGKTTALNILSGYIPANERILTIEDSAELQLQQPHVVRLETRPANVEGRGEITQRDLVKNSLRMRPDRIVVGEVRGAEALDMLTAMNTGHEGSLGTVHANNPRDALSRIENMVAMAGFDMPVKNIRNQIASAIDVVVQLERQEDGKRRIISISEITGMEGEVITVSEIFAFRRQGLDSGGQVLGHFEPTGVIPRFHERLKSRGLELPFELFGVSGLLQGVRNV